MPFSSESGKLWRKRLIKRLNGKCVSKSILDVGAGAGKYSDLLRPILPGTTFAAIEVWEPYVEEYNLKRKYDELHQQDVREFVPDKRYGVTIFGDVLEHLTKEEAIEVYNKLLKSSEFVLISIPIVHYPQDVYKGNPYEEHKKDDWSHEEVMATFPHLAVSYVENEIGMYVGFNPELYSEKDVKDALRPTIAVYGIYKNEAAFMQRFLDSVKYADEIVICDTGSTDGTNEIISEFRKSNPDVPLSTYKILVSPWRFDDARNTALSLVNPEIDLCISLDIDEYLMDGWKEYLIDHWEYGITRYNHKFKTFWPEGGETEHWHERIHSRLGYTWKLPVHEILEYNGEEKIKFLWEFWMYQKPDTSKSRSSYLPLLEQSVKERKDVWKSWSFLAEEYISAGRYDDAMQAIDTAINIENSDKSYLHYIKSRVYGARNETALVKLSLDQAIHFLPGRREPYYSKALYLHQIGNNTEAWFALKEAERIQNRVTDYHYNISAWDESFEQLKNTVLELARKEGQLL